VRLGDGVSPMLSPDGKYVLAMVPSAGDQRDLTMIPTGAGEPRKIATGDVRVHQAYFFPDGHGMLELGNSAGVTGLRLWVQDGETGKPRAISPEGVDFRSRGCISPDGSRVAAVNPEGKIVIYLVASGEPQDVPGAKEGDRCVQWTPQGKSLLVTPVDVQDKIYKIDFANGDRKLFQTISLLDQTGLQDSGAPSYSRDLKSYVYSYSRITSDLYIVEGLK
jgi:Tol biopolymer transport system component